MNRVSYAAPAIRYVTGERAPLKVNLMTPTTKLIQQLNSISETGYGTKLPGPHDSTFAEFARAYSRSDTDEKQRIRESIPENMRMLLLGFGDRLATVADRTRDEELLWLAFLAHAIEDFRYDERENVFRLALLHHVAKKLGLDPSSLLERAAGAASARGAKRLRAFDARPPELKSLRAMKIVEERTSSGVGYRYE